MEETFNSVLMFVLFFFADKLLLCIGDTWFCNTMTLWIYLVGDCNMGADT